MKNSGSVAVLMSAAVRDVGVQIVEIVGRLAAGDEPVQPPPGRAVARLIQGGSDRRSRRAGDGELSGSCRLPVRNLDLDAAVGGEQATPWRARARHWCTTTLKSTAGAAGSASTAVTVLGPVQDLEGRQLARRGLSADSADQAMHESRSVPTRTTIRHSSRLCWPIAA